VPGELTRKAVFAQPEWLRGVPDRVGDRRLPDGRVVFTGCGTSFHAAQTGGESLQALVGWMPSLVGIGVRGILYKLFLKSEGIPAIEDHVRLSRTEDIVFGRGVFIDHGSYLHGGKRAGHDRYRLHRPEQRPGTKGVAALKLDALRQGQCGASGQRQPEDRVARPRCLLRDADEAQELAAMPRWRISSAFISPGIGPAPTRDGTAFTTITAPLILRQLRPTSSAAAATVQLPDVTYG